MAKPSWCLAVIVTYFIPASLARRTHSLASKRTGLNWEASFSYSPTGILPSCMIHSPMLGVLQPFHSPASAEYRPQWMNRP